MQRLILSVPTAKEPDKKANWSYDYEFMQKVQRTAEKIWSEQVSLEMIDAVIQAMQAISLNDVGKLQCSACGSTFIYIEGRTEI